MRIAILSDLHLGYAWGTEREEDSFRQAKEALKKAASADLILIAGDIFDSRIPKQEILSRAIRMFSELKFKESDTNLISIKNRKRMPEIKLDIPIVVIYGTHERRGKGMKNPVHVLEEAGFFLNLHKQVALFELDGEKVAIHGISGVPESVANQVIIKEAKLSPVKDAANVLMLHQSFKEFMYSDEYNPAMSIKEMPSGFDLIVNGHIHWINKINIGETLFLIPGSTVTTQIRKTESKIPKTMFFFDTKTKELRAEELETTRKVVYKEIDCTNLDVIKIKEKILGFLGTLNKEKIKPLTRIKLIGEINEIEKNLNFTEIVNQYKEDFILTIKSNLKSKKQQDQAEFIREILDNKLSIEEIGLRILNENAKNNKLELNITNLYELLKEGEIELAEKEIMDSSLDKKEAIKKTWKASPPSEKANQKTLF